MTPSDPVSRPDGRALDQLRPLQVEYGIAPSALGSVKISFGQTQVICGCSVEESLPGWMRAQNVQGGWLTAEYSMLPYSTPQRNRRETGKLGGRTMEIQRLIGRSLRAVVDLEKLGPRSFYLDCDVLQADGGTRTASITGAWLALRQAVGRLMHQGKITSNPLTGRVAAISVGIVKEVGHLDLCYLEDVAAEVDMNVVMTGDGRYVEVQGTAESAPFSPEQLQELLRLAGKGIADIIEATPETAIPE